MKRLPIIFACLLSIVLLGGFIFYHNFMRPKNTKPYDQMAVMDVVSQQPLQRVEGKPGHKFETSMSDELSKDVKNYWQETGGKGLVVWHKGEIVLERYAEGITQDSRSRSYSMHKSIVGLVAAMMAEDGFIDLDDPIADYVPAFNVGPRKTVTLRNALQHTTGLSAFSMASGSQESKDLLMGDKIEETALKAVRETDPATFNYANVNYQLAGAAIRAALLEKTGQSYADYLSRKLWQPLHANDAYLWAESKKGAPRFYAGLQASARDWLRVGILVASEGRFDNREIVSPDVIKTFLEPAASNPNYGLGVWLGAPDDGLREYGPTTPFTVIHSAPFRYKDTVFFDGFGGQRVYISPSEDLVVVRTGDIQFEWDDARLFNMIANRLEGVSEQDLKLMTPNERQVKVRVLSPLNPCAECPDILFSTGAFATPYDYDRLLVPIAKAGFNIWIPQHVDARNHPKKADYPQEQGLALRVEDMTTLLAHIEAKTGDDDWIVMGHSYGALIAQTLAGADMSDQLGAPLDITPPARVIAISPPGAVENYIAETAFETLETPMLVITGDKDVVPPFASRWQDHLLSFETAKLDTATALIFDNIDHYFNGYYGRETGRDKTDMDDYLTSVLIDFSTSGKLPMSRQGVVVTRNDSDYSQPDLDNGTFE